ncbi:hypothetical protein MRX96_057013 [Rhipicephalus microplus]
MAGNGVSGVATEGGKGPAVFRPKDAAQSVILASLEATPHGVHVLSLLRQFRRPPGIAYCVVCLSVPEAGEMTNVDLASKGITDIVLRYTRYGLTVLSNTNDTIQNLVQAIQKNAVTHASISVRVPNKRNPHIRITGGDPDVDKDTFFNILKERNAGLEIDEERCKVRVAFCERSGTNTFIGEVDLESFKALMSWPRLSLGLTVLQVSDCLHAPTCTFCVTYGHGRSSSPHKTEASRATCMKYVGNHKVVGCTVCMGERAVNLDHAGLATTNLFHKMTELGVSLAAVSDPYRSGMKLPSQPPGFQYVAAERDPVVAVIMQRAPFDIFPLLVSELVVAIYFEANDTDFVFISAYAPPHKSMEHTLVLVKRVLTRLRTRNIIVAGDFHAKYSAWDAQASDPRGCRLVEFAAETPLFFNIVIKGQRRMGLAQL